ncbi:MAG: hypothetical protein ACK4SF_13210 [Algoriphagus aquaeductus]|uniref:hypothetical protein n=1 Tax=Algoriphagus aquaeductus TaxID=475299 RepID=UPI00391B9B58
MNYNKINKYIKLYFERLNINSSNFDNINGTILEIKTDPNPEFHKKWNYLMTLVSVLESEFQIRNIVNHDNYTRFEFDKINIQEKGVTKIESFYLVCVNTLNKYWKKYEGIEELHLSEPFDINERD